VNELIFNNMTDQEINKVIAEYVGHKNISMQTIGEDIVLTWAIQALGFRVGYAEDAIVFTNVPEQPVPSICAGSRLPSRSCLTSPMIERLLLMANDPDEFNRWDAGQQLAVKHGVAFYGEKGGKDARRIISGGLEFGKAGSW
jgi:hypothetical protein